MPTLPLPHSVLLETGRLIALQGDTVAASAALGVPRSTVMHRLRAIRRLWPDWLPAGSNQPGWAVGRPLAPPDAGQALRGEVGGPPIPLAAVPPPGFHISRNSGEYGPEGELRRQWVGSRPAPGEVFDPLPGHTVKGESALLDPSGRVIAKWVKTREGDAAAGLLDACVEAFSAFRGAAIPADQPAASDDTLLTVYGLPDLHLGMHAWGRETGTDYDVPAAVAQTEEAFRDLTRRSPPARTGVLLGLGDYFHQQDSKGVTPGSGHHLDVDGRWPKVYAAGARLAVSSVDTMLQAHQDVEVVVLPGNHDPDVATTLTVALALYYERDPRVTVWQHPGLFWYRRHGAVLLGATHGHTMKPDRMVGALAQDRAADWGATTHRHMFSGHRHHERAQEIMGVRVETLQAAAPRDGWNHAAGHRSGRSQSAITFHAESGERERHRVSF